MSFSINDTKDAVCSLFVPIGIVAIIINCPSSVLGNPSLPINFNPKVKIIIENIIEGINIIFLFFIENINILL